MKSCFQFVQLADLGFPTGAGKRPCLQGSGEHLCTGLELNLPTGDIWPFDHLRHKMKQQSKLVLI